MSSHKGIAQEGVSIVVALTVMLLIVALVLVPVGLGALQGDSTTTLNQSVSDGPVEVLGKVESNVTKVGTAVATNNATIELNDTDTAGTVTKTIDNGSEKDFTLQDGTITANVSEVGSNYAIVTYSYPSDYNLSAGTSGLLGLIGIISALAIMLIMLAWGLNVL